MQSGCASILLIFEAINELQLRDVERVVNQQIQEALRES